MSDWAVVRSVKRRTGGMDREAVQWLLATCGVIASVLGVAQYLWPNGATVLNVWWVLGMFGFGIGAGTLLRLTRRSIVARSSSGSWTIEVTSGDVLDHRPCALTTDRRRTLSMADIAPDSLVGQFLRRLEGTSRAEFEQIVEASKTASLARPGDVIRIDLTGDSPVFLLACGRPTRNGTVTLWSHLSQAYDGLWSATRAAHLGELTVPVVGAGYSRVNLSHSAVLLALMLSFHAASLERPVCARLRIVIPPNLLDQEELVLARRFLSALHYSLR